MPFGLFDPTMLLLVPAMIFAFWAQWKVTHTYRQYSQVRAANGLTGSQMAKAIMNRNGVTDVAVEEVGGVLSDHYDPRARKVRLSASVFREPSLAALAVGAHEVGHVLQHAQGYAPLALRSAIAPVAGFGSLLAFPLFFIGFIFQGDALAWLENGDTGTSSKTIWHILTGASQSGTMYRMILTTSVGVIGS